MLWKHWFYQYRCISPIKKAIFDPFVISSLDNLFSKQPADLPVTSTDEN